MTNKAFTKKVAREINVTELEAQDILKKVFGVLKDSVMNEGGVTVKDFGVFKLSGGGKKEVKLGGKTFKNPVKNKISFTPNYRSKEYDNDAVIYIANHYIDDLVDWNRVDSLTYMMRIKDDNRILEKIFKKNGKFIKVSLMVNLNTVEIGILENLIINGSRDEKLIKVLKNRKGDALELGDIINVVYKEYIKLYM